MRKRYRTLNVLDEGSRECLAIGVGSSLSADQVIRTLKQLKTERGQSQQILLDNSPEFISAKLMDWCKKHEVKIHYIQPGKLQQNAFIESFNSTFRRDFLNAYLCSSHCIKCETWLSSGDWIIKRNKSTKA